MPSPKFTDHIQLPGSQKMPADNFETFKKEPDSLVTVMLRLRRGQPIDTDIKTGVHFSRSEYKKAFCASDEDIIVIKEFAAHYNLTVDAIDKVKRTVHLTGTLTDLEHAFQVTIKVVRDQKQTYRVREGHIYIPRELEGIVEGVFGLDNRPQARPMYQVAREFGPFVAHGKADITYTADKVGKIYGFPIAVNGTGQTIAIIELGGGYRMEDLNAYFQNLGISVPTVISVALDGGSNAPSNADSDDGEVMLDIEVAGSIAPGAKIVVYFTSNTDKGFLDAVASAIHDEVNDTTVMSISWGAAEVNWTEQSLNNLNDLLQTAALLGITVCVAAGDQGSSDNINDGKVHADFPASSPYALACGGTRLIAENNMVVSETVWHDSRTSATGGGISDFFKLPDYQSGIDIPLSLNTGFKGRGIPDIAGNADPATGYEVLVDGQRMVIGGTSAVAPLMAGLIAIENQRRGIKAGFINPLLYAHPQLCRNIVSGNNRTAGNNLGYDAGPGWDPCTGWGILSGLGEIKDKNEDTIS